MNETRTTTATLTDEQIDGLVKQHTWFNGSHAMTNYRDLVRAAFALAALPAADSAIKWPKARDLFLRDDMGQGQLRVLFDSDNDVIVAVWPNGQPSAAVEFCNGGGGGGKSPNTRAALIALMCAMERDGASERPKD
jgi:hypothetical protein